MTDQGLSIFDEQSGKGSPDDKTQVIPVASRGGQEAPQAPAGGSGGAQRPVVPPATRPSGAPAAGGAAPGGFPVVRRGGYDPSAVDSRVRQLLGEKTGLAQSLTESETRVLELEAELERVRTEVAEMERPSYAGLGGRASAMLRLAEEEGGTFATGGKVQSKDGELSGGFWIEPTVIAGLDNSSRLAQEEVFGPVLVVIPHDGDDDAVRIANDSEFGLSGSVTGGDLERATAVANRIRTGTIAVNGGVWFSPDAPFGGYKQSGLGREMGVAGFEEYLEVKTLAFPA